MDYSMDFDDDFAAEHGELYGDSGGMDGNNSFGFADISSRDEDMSIYTTQQSDSSSSIVESKDSRYLNDAWTEEELKRLKTALEDASSSGNVLQTLKDMFPSKSYDSIKQQIQIYSPRLVRLVQTRKTIEEHFPLIEAPAADGKPPPKKRAPKPKNSTSAGSRTGDETRAGDSPAQEEEIPPPDASSDGDYEEPAGGRKRKISAATKSTAGKKKTPAGKSEAGKTTTRQKKPKLADEPSSPAAPSPGGPVTVTAPTPALYGPDGSRINMTVVSSGPYGPPGSINTPNVSAMIKTEMPPQFQTPYPPYGGAPPPTQNNMSASGASGYSTNVRQQMEALMAENDLLLRCIREYVPDPMKNLDYMLRFRENTFDLLRLCSRQPACFQHMPVLPVRIQSLQSLIQGAHSARFRETIQQRPSYGMATPQTYAAPVAPPPQSPTYGSMAPPSPVYSSQFGPPPNASSLSAEYQMRPQGPGPQMPMAYAPHHSHQSPSSHQT